jgi:hypothetical protein
MGNHMALTLGKPPTILPVAFYAQIGSPSRNQGKHDVFPIRHINQNLPEFLPTDLSIIGCQQSSMLNKTALHYYGYEII